MPPPGASRRSSTKNWFLPLVWFFLALALAVLMMVNGERLANSGLVNQIYYLILIALGLAAAGSLFGVLRSQARYQGQSSWGTLEVGGPAVVFLLVVGAGVWFAPERRSFPLTVFIHGPGGHQDMVLRGGGRVMIDLDGDR